jgi:hypothetical protein
MLVSNTNAWQSIFPCQDANQLFELPFAPNFRIAMLEDEMENFCYCSSAEQNSHKIREDIEESQDSNNAQIK